MYARNGRVVQFIAGFTNAGLAATGLTVTAKVWELRSDGSKVPNDATGATGSVTEVGGGVYRCLYTMTGDGVPLAVFSTAGVADVKTVQTSALSLDRVSADMKAIEGDLLSGNLATLKLKKLDVRNADAYGVGAYIEGSGVGVQVTQTATGADSPNQGAVYLTAATTYPFGRAVKLVSTGSGIAIHNLFDILTSTLTTASSLGKLIVDFLNAAVGTRASQTSVDAVAGYVDTEVAAIKAKTDLIPASPAVSGEAAAALVAYDAATGTDVANVAIDLTPVLTAVGDLPTAAENADAVWDEDLSGHVIAGSTGEALDATRDQVAPPPDWTTVTQDTLGTDGQPLGHVAPEAIVVARLNGVAMYRTTAEIDGDWALPLPPDVTWTLVATAPGYQTSTAEVTT